jgi:hypothetical protein
MAITRKVVAGQTIDAADFRQYFGDHFSSFVKTGFEVTDDTGLDVSVSAGTAYVKNATGEMYQVVSGAAESMTMENNDTNYVFLHSDNGANYLTSSTTATVPDDAILLGTVVTAAGDVSSVTDNRVTTPAVRSPSVVSCPAGLGSIYPTTTMTYYFYLNPSGTRLINLKKIKTRGSIVGVASVAVSYDIGAGYVSIRNYTSSGSNTDTLDVSSTDSSYNVAIKVVSTSANEGSYAYIYDLSVGFDII